MVGPVGPTVDWLVAAPVGAVVDELFAGPLAVAEAEAFAPASAVIVAKLEPVELAGDFTPIEPSEPPMSPENKPKIAHNNNPIKPANKSAAAGSRRVDR